MHMHLHDYNRSAEKIFHPKHIDLVNIHSAPKKLYPGNLNYNSLHIFLTFTERRRQDVENKDYSSSRLLALCIFWTINIKNLKPFKLAFSFYIVRHNK